MHADLLQKLQHINTLMPLKVTLDDWFTKQILILHYTSIGINKRPFEEIVNARREAVHIILHLLNVRMFTFYGAS